MMYHHLSVNASQLLCANLPVNKNMGDILAAECALFTGCSYVMLINIDAFASFSTLYLFVSDILLTHTHTFERPLRFFPTRARSITKYTACKGVLPNPFAGFAVSFATFGQEQTTTIFTHKPVKND